MKKEYDIEKLNPRINPYAQKMKQQITINLNCETIDYFKTLSQEFGIGYQTLINLYLADCVKEKRQIKINWS
ncbi:MAG: BrnA antitoxin family protein [Clostridiaceae bacterium]|nr:BrnA antitoxin family protein [Clostridiaceae bacterium]HHT25456.1 BrnA antitoxin family protein [Clostridiaceae bacterium]